MTLAPITGRWLWSVTVPASARDVPGNAGVGKGAVVRSSVVAVEIDAGVEVGPVGTTGELPQPPDRSRVQREMHVVFIGRSRRRHRRLSWRLPSRFRRCRPGEVLASGSRVWRRCSPGCAKCQGANFTACVRFAHLKGTDQIMSPWRRMSYSSRPTRTQSSSRSICTFTTSRTKAGSRLLETGWLLHHVQDKLGHANVSQAIETLADVRLRAMTFRSYPSAGRTAPRGVALRSHGAFATNWPITFTRSAAYTDQFTSAYRTHPTQSM